MHRLKTFPLLLAASALLAQQPPTGTWVQAQGGLVLQRQAPCVDRDLGAGVAAGRWLSPRWGLEAGVLETRLHDQAGLWHARETHLDGSALLGLVRAPAAWHPFLRVGAGATRLEAPLSLSAAASTRLNVMAGLGLQYFSPGGAMASLEVRAASVRSGEPRTECQVLAGLGGHW